MPIGRPDSESTNRACPAQPARRTEVTIRTAAQSEGRPHASSRDRRLLSGRQALRWLGAEGWACSRLVGFAPARENLRPALTVARCSPMGALASRWLGRLRFASNAANAGRVECKGLIVNGSSGSLRAAAHTAHVKRTTVDVHVLAALGCTPWQRADYSTASEVPHLPHRRGQAPRCTPHQISSGKKLSTDKQCWEALSPTTADSSCITAAAMTINEKQSDACVLRLNRMGRLCSRRPSRCHRRRLPRGGR